MPQNVAFHQGLHCLLKQSQFQVQKKQFNFEGKFQSKIPLSVFLAYSNYIVLNTLEGYIRGYTSNERANLSWSTYLTLTEMFDEAGFASTCITNSDNLQQSCKTQILALAMNLYTYIKNITCFCQISFNILRKNHYCNSFSQNIDFFSCLSLTNLLKIYTATRSPIFRTVCQSSCIIL